MGVITINDHEILNLFWARDEAALAHVKDKYGRSLHIVAYNILANNHDAEECVNDTLHRAWEVIPPKRPDFLGAYLSKITRNLSLERWRARGTAKRGGGQVDLLLSELSDAVPTANTAEDSFEYNLTVSAINTCLREMDKNMRVIFIRRYVFGDSVADICRHFGHSESKVKSVLYRARNKLKFHLEKEGVYV